MCLLETSQNSTLFWNLFALFIGWPYGPFLRDAPLPGFLYCLKYPGFGCLHCADRSLYDIISGEQSRRLLMLSNRSRSTLVSYNDRCAASSRTNKQTRARICIALIIHLLTRHDWSIIFIPACYCQTTLDVLGNIKSWPGCVPYKCTYDHPTYLGSSKFKCTRSITDRCGVVSGADAQQSGVSARGVCRCGKCSRCKLRKDRLHARHRIRPKRIRVWCCATCGAQKKVKTHDHSHFVTLRSKQWLHCNLKWFLSYLDK